MFGCDFFYWEQIAFAIINLADVKADEANYSWLIIVPLVLECASCAILLLFKQRVGLGKGLKDNPRVRVNDEDERQRGPPNDNPNTI